MQRLTISMDDELAARFDLLIQQRGYANRSEAVRDMIRQMLALHVLKHHPEEEAVGIVSYAYNHHERQLAPRLTNFQHSHSQSMISTLHVHIDESECVETAIFRGKSREVQRLANEMMALPCVRHGSLNLIPILKAESLEREHDHLHDHEHSHGDYLHSHPHDHDHHHHEDDHHH